MKKLKFSVGNKLSKDQMKAIKGGSPDMKCHCYAKQLGGDEGWLDFMYPAPNNHCPEHYNNWCLDYIEDTWWFVTSAECYGCCDGSGGNGTSCPF